MSFHSAGRFGSIPGKTAYIRLVQQSSISALLFSERGISAFWRNFVFDPCLSLHWESFWWRCPAAPHIKTAHWELSRRRKLHIKCLLLCWSFSMVKDRYSGQARNSSQDPAKTFLHPYILMLCRNKTAWRAEVCTYFCVFSFPVIKTHCWSKSLLVASMEVQMVRSQRSKTGCQGGK